MGWARDDMANPACAELWLPSSAPKLDAKASKHISTESQRIACGLRWCDKVDVPEVEL